jgi:hypothetical protein
MPRARPIAPITPCFTQHAPPSNAFVEELGLPFARYTLQRAIDMVFGEN